MHGRSYVLLGCCLALLSLLPESAEARRGRRYQNYSYSDSESLDIAPYSEAKKSEPRALKVYYNYNSANAPQVAFTDKIRVSLAVQEKGVLEVKEPLVAEVRVTDLSNSGTYHVRYIPIALDAEPRGRYTYGSFDLTNQGEKQPLINPSKVYRLFVNLHRKSKVYGKQTLLGRVPSPYYVATSGETTLDRARQQIVMRTFKEFYYRKRGWRSGENYSMDCYAYYMWATGFCTVGAENGRTQLSRLFGDKVPYHNGGQIPQLSKKGVIHGDYVRQPGHSFMLLAYDPKKKQVWTMEGNFNSTVEVAIRSVSSGWTVGHLREKHIRPGLFPRLRDRIREMIDR